MISLVFSRGKASLCPAVARHLASLLASGVLFLSAAAAHAGTFVYTGDSGNYERFPDLPQEQRNNDWQNPYNWDVLSVPGTGDSVTIPDGEVVFLRNSVTVANLTLHSSQLDGYSGELHGLTVTGTFNWNADAGETSYLGFNTFSPLNIPAGAKFNITGAGVKQANCHVVNLQGTADWSGGNIRTTSTWNNNGTFILRSGKFFGNDDTRYIPIFNNTGTVVKRESSGNTSFSGYDNIYYISKFHNTGRVDVETGNVTFGEGSSTGIFNALAVAGITFDGPHRLANVNLPGPGSYILMNANGIAMGLTGNINVGGTLEHRSGYVVGGNVDSSAGNYTGGSVQFSGKGQYVWTGGYASGYYKFASGFTSRWAGNTNRDFVARIDNSGMLIWGGNAEIVSFNGVINNLAGATFDIRGDGILRDNRGGALVTVNNAGTLVKSAGTGTSQIGGGNISNSGLVEVRSGTLQFVYSAYNQTAGNTILSGGSLGIESGGNSASRFNISGGYLSGRGLVSGDVVNNGVVAPGLGQKPGVLNITGSYTQGSTGKLVIKVAGRDAALKQYSQLKVTGAVSLNGNQTTRWFNGFVPSARDSFKIILHNGVSGTFSSLNGNVLSDGRALKAFYHPNDVALGLPLSISGRAIQWVWDGTAFVKQGIAATNISLNGPNGVVRTVTTNDNGNYTVNGLEAGTYTGSASKEGVTFHSPAPTVTLPTRGIEGVSPNGAITFRTYTIRVRLVNSDGTPIAGLYVWVQPQKPGRAPISVLTNAKGFATIPNLGRDTYTITPQGEEGKTYDAATKTVTLPTTGVQGISPNATVKFTATSSASGALQANPSGNAF